MCASIHQSPAWKMCWEDLRRDWRIGESLGKKTIWVSCGLEKRSRHTERELWVCCIYLEGSLHAAFRQALGGLLCASPAGRLYYFFTSFAAHGYILKHDVRMHNYLSSFVCWDDLCLFLPRLLFLFVFLSSFAKLNELLSFSHCFTTNGIQTFQAIIIFI